MNSDRVEPKARTWRRRSGKYAVALATSSFILAACGSSASSSSSSSGTTAASSGPQTITWWSSPLGAGAADIRAKLISTFEKAYPNIKVNLVSAPTNTDTNRAQLTTQISGGSASPDVFMGDVIWPAQFGAHGLALPLSKYLPSSYWSQFAPGLVQGATYKGQIYGSPMFEDQGFLFYRKDLLQAANLPVPTTWQQLEQEAVQLVKAGSVQNGFVWEGNSYEGLTCNFMEYLGSAGGNVVNSGYTQSTINSAAGQKALAFMRSLITSGASPASVTTMQEPQAESTFVAGNAAFLRNWSYAWSDSQTTAGSAVVGKVGVTALPTFAGQSGTGYANIGGWNLYVNPHSAHVSADLTFIKWMAGTTAQTMLANASFIPTLQSVRQQFANSTTAPPPLQIAAKENLIPRPSGSPNYAAVSQAIYTNVNSALTGSSSVSAALTSAASQMNSALGGGL